MKIKLKKILAAVFALTLFTGILTSCSRGGNNTTTTGSYTTLQALGPEDNTWRNGLPSNESSTVTDVYKTETQVSKTVLNGISLDKATAFGSSGNDMFARVVATPDGGFAATGIFGAANGDCKKANPAWQGTKGMLVKYDKSSKVEWSAFLGGDNGVEFNALARLADGSYIVVGDTQSSDLGVKLGQGLQALMVKYSSSGSLVWTKLVGGSKGQYFSSVAATPDGGYVAGGKTESSNGDFAGLKPDSIKAVLIKYDSDGSPRWKRALSGTMHNNFENIAVNSNGDIFAGCLTMSDDGDFKTLAGRGQTDSVIFKYDRSGNFKWAEPISGSGIDEMTSVAPSPDGGCVVAGRYSINIKNDGSFKTFFNAGGFDAFMMKFNSDGTIGWAKPFAGFLDDRFTGITAVNGGYALVGATESNNRDFQAIGNLGLQDGFLLLINELGDTVNLTALAGTKDDMPRAASCLNGYTVFVVGGTMSEDHTFAGLKPAADGTYNAFTAAFSTSF
jgi:hypothetical protein